MIRNCLTLALLAALSTSALALSSTFTYQGSLQDGAAPANGSYDLQFALQTQAGVPVGAALLRDDVVVTGGVFTVELDFAASISSADFQLQIGVRPGASVGANLSTVSGGQENIAAGVLSAVSGGFGNCAGGDSSWAGGNFAKVRPGNQVGDFPCVANSSDANGDNGTFIWADDQPTDFISTGPRQFLVRAQGGMAINTNTPTAGATLTVAPLVSGNTSSTISLTGAGEGSVTALSGDLRLRTSSIGKYIYTNDRFGVQVRPVANALEVSGDASKTTAGAWLANSDRRIKTDIATIPNALDRLSALRPVTFHYTPEYLAAHPSIKDVNYYNVIAQEFQAVFPDAVKGSGEYLSGKAQTPENEILQVDTYPAQILAIAAIQELNAKLELENAALKKSDTELRERLAAIEAKLSR